MPYPLHRYGIADDLKNLSRITKINKKYRERELVGISRFQEISNLMTIKKLFREHLENYFELKDTSSVPRNLS